MGEVSKYIQSIFKNLAFSFIGTPLLLLIIIYASCCIPVYFYRLLVCKVLAPTFNKKLGKAVNLSGIAFALELVGKRIQEQPRCTVATSLTLQGSLNFQEFQQLVKTHWINKRGPFGSLVYPEFRQYIMGWMGYLFWQTDSKFDIRNHFKKHVIKPNASEAECERFICNIKEDLINKTWTPNRSPWEFHLIYNYRNSEILPLGKDMTVAILRVHHCIGDGIPLFNACFDGLFGIPMSKWLLATPHKDKSGQMKDNVMFLFRFIRDLGFVFWISLNSKRTPWNIPIEQRSGKQFYCKSKRLPLNQIKKVKEAYGVSLTSVLLSSVAAGIDSAFKTRNCKVNTIPFGLPIPLPRHSLKLRNHVTGIMFQLPVDGKLTPSQRLKKTEKLFQFGRQSTHVHLVPIVKNLTMLHAYPLASLLNTFTVDTFGSNLPGSGIPLILMGCKVLSKEFGVGLLPGVAGVAFTLISYDGNIQLVVTSENAAMERNEVKCMINAIEKEVKSLYELAKMGDLERVPVIESV